MLYHLLQSHLKDKITAREQSVSTESSPKEEVTEEDRTGTNCDHILLKSPSDHELLFHCQGVYSCLPRKAVSPILSRIRPWSLCDAPSV